MKMKGNKNMISFEKCGEICADKIIEVYDREKMDKLAMQYGIATLFYNGLTSLGVILMAFFCSTWKETILVVLVFGSLRLTLGGTHCNTAKNCFLCTIAVTVGSALLSRYICFSTFAFLIFALVLVVLSYMYILLRAKENPIKPQMRDLKWTGLLLESLYVVIGYKNVELRTIFLLSIMCAVMTILPMLNEKYRLKKI